jgi:hypothetical protein
MDNRPPVGLCVGKDCRRADAFRTVERELRASCDVADLSCLDVCDGPVVVLGVRTDTPVVIERVRSRAMVNDVIEHVTAGAELPGKVRKRIVSGSKRAKARRRIARGT